MTIDAVRSRPRLVTTVLVGAAGLLLLCAGARLTHLDDLIGWPFPAFNAFTPLLYLPAYPLAAVALLRYVRQRGSDTRGPAEAARPARAITMGAVAVAMVGVIASHLVWTVPEFVGAGQRAGSASTAASVRLMTANVNGANTEVARIAGQLDRERPGLLLLEEYTPLIAGRLHGLTQLRAFPYVVERPSLEPYGYAVFSRFPLTGRPDLNSAGFPFARMDVALGGGRHVELVVVHTRSPVGATYTRRWARQLADLRTDACQARRPLVFAGDFNATRDHRPFRRLLACGLHDAHDVAGGGWSPTWSATAWWKETTRIDHILVSSDITVSRYHRGSPFGSDHLPISADLRI